ncbi:Uncharacterised protein [Klebsiella pneumoniae subsp. ozaenae]|uniref:Uncharacterized protein n=1 Tax=Klebsiella pneumoniae subsp. ozaenae TaxID=574 RepID=A0A378AYN3_KLEPO|nr:Uncharacterised protein [Klebsiella pneumoniae subsp. ozaenae]
MAKAPDIIPKEALAWLKSKKLTPGFDYRDVWKQEHSIGFTVAKMTQLDLLSDVKALVEDAMASGQSFAEFQGGTEAFAGEAWMVGSADDG